MTPHYWFRSFLDFSTEFWASLKHCQNCITIQTIDIQLLVHLNRLSVPNWNHYKYSVLPEISTWQVSLLFLCLCEIVLATATLHNALFECVYGCVEQIGLNEYLHVIEVALTVTPASFRHGHRCHLNQHNLCVGRLLLF